MKIDEKNLLGSILESLSHIDYIKPKDLPNIDLYMDQVTTYLNDKFAALYLLDLKPLRAQYLDKLILLVYLE